MASLLYVGQVCVVSAGDPGSVVPAVTRAVAFLDTLAAADGRPLSVSEPARTLGLPKSSTRNLCATLEATGLVTRSGSGFALGRKWNWVVASCPRWTGCGLSTSSRRSAHIAGETARVAVLDGLEVP
ncbi:helix-turn-helix domain-containing protein [Streptomyces europaeiscabiei]|uniref:helix-turn-helix domain-containing protein n=1 Tax=Streptomyces europaeiscabiei TaxID=146819 RepID=UPI0029AB20C7|nr:helix-turn-helix domain-containing protein [Streptomyces europaeiscabiei]MDX3694673.1 helix-turn-helix domain-containing protein [Streptomyces europaeiscabiei]